MWPFKRKSRPATNLRVPADELPRQILFFGTLSKSRDKLSLQMRLTGTSLNRFAGLTYPVADQVSIGVRDVGSGDEVTITMHRPVLEEDRSIVRQLLGENAASSLIDANGEFKGIGSGIRVDGGRVNNIIDALSVYPARR